MSTVALRPAAIPLPKSTQSSFRVTVTDLLIGLTLIWSSIPETWTGEVYFYDVPLRFCLLYSVVFSSVLSSFFFGISRVSPFLLAALIAMLTMASWGLLRANDTKFWVIDVSNFLGFVLGLYWANRYPLQRIVGNLFWWTLSIELLVIINLVGLVTGFILPASEGDRVYSYSLFTSATFLTLMFPLWFNLKSTEIKSAVLLKPHTLAVMSIASVIFASLLSATRSMYISAVVAILLVLWQRLNQKNSLFWLLSTAAIAYCMSVYAFTDDSWLQTGLAQRLDYTEIAEEHRFRELEMMFDQLDGSWLWGMGFGSRFDSCISTDEGSLAYSPHIGFVTLIYKGGIFVFGLLILAPLVHAVYRMGRMKGTNIALASCCMILLYCVQSMMSGGWDFISLFVLGAAISILSRTCKSSGTSSSVKQRSQLRAS